MRKEESGSVNIPTMRWVNETYGTVSQPTFTFHRSNVIEYEDGYPYHPDGAARWKSCVHSWNISPGRCDLRGHVRHKRWADETYAVEFLVPGSDWWNSSIRSAYSRTTEFSDAEMLHEAEHAMEGRLSQTLLPITDLVQLTRRVDGLGSADALLTSLLAPFRAKPKTWSDLVKKVSGADLARKFGVQTLMKTITDAIQYGAVVENHLRRLERIQNAQQRNFRVSVNRSGIVSRSTGAHLWSNLQSDYIVDGDVTVGYVSEASIHFRTSVRYDTSDALRTRLVWDALGLSNIFSTAWDLMPLSFVIDWVVRVQEFAARLDSYYFQTVPLERMTELQDVWITQTRKGYAKFSGFVPRNKASLQWTTSLDNPDTTFQIDMGTFTRRPVNPASTSAWLPSLKISGSSLTLAQTITGLELLIQRSF